MIVLSVKPRGRKKIADNRLSLHCCCCWAASGNIVSLKHYNIYPKKNCIKLNDLILRRYELRRMRPSLILSLNGTLEGYEQRFLTDHHSLYTYVRYFFLSLSLFSFLSLICRDQTKLINLAGRDFLERGRKKSAPIIQLRLTNQPSHNFYTRKFRNLSAKLLSPQNLGKLWREVFFSPLIRHRESRNKKAVFLSCSSKARH